MKTPFALTHHLRFVEKSSLLLGLVLAALQSFASWTYDETTQKVTDGNWVIPVTGTRDALTLGCAETRGSTTVLDLTTGIEGGGAFVALGDRCLQQAAGNIKTTVTEVRLPDTLLSIGEAAFADCTSLTKVTPFLPASVVSIGNSAFFDCPKLRGDLVLSNPDVAIATTTGNYAAFRKCGLDSADLSATKITETATGLFRESTNLKSVKYPRTLATLGPNSHYGCTSLSDISFLSFPTFTGGDTFGNGKAMPNARITFPASNSGWLSYMSNNGTFVSWDASSSSYKNGYVNTFGDVLMPAGYAKIIRSDLSADSQYAGWRWLVPVPEQTQEVTLTVDGNPAVCDVTPAYGDFGVVSSLPLECSAPGEEVVGDVVYRCVGYRLGSFQGTSVVYGDLVEEHTLSFNPCESGSYFLKWEWEEAAYKVEIGNYPAEYGSVTIDAEPYHGIDGYYAANQTLTLTATSAAGRQFRKWCGMVSDAEASLSQLAIVLTAPRKLMPYFNGSWTYDSASGTVSDGYWVIPATGERAALALGKPTDNGGVDVLDLRTGVEGGGAFASIAENFIGTAPEGIRTSLVEAHLPETIVAVPGGAFRNAGSLKVATISSQTTSIGDGAFRGCTELARVTPFLPDTVVELGEGAFAGTAKLAVPLSLNIDHGDLGMDSYAWNLGVFYGCGCTSVDMSRSSITNICSGSFRETPNIASVQLPPNLVRIGGAAFFHSESLATVTPFLPDSVETLCWAAFCKCTKLRGNLVVSNAKATADGGGTAADYRESTFFTTGIDSADFSLAKGMTSIPTGFLRETPNLRSVKYPKTVLEIGGSINYGCPSLEDIQFQSYPSNFVEKTSDGFGSGMAYGRIVYPADDAGWKGYLDANTNGNFTAWDPDSDEARAYLSRFEDGWKPIGYMTIGLGTKWGACIKWMVPHNFKPGLMLMLK